MQTKIFTGFICLVFSVAFFVVACSNEAIVFDESFLLKLNLEDTANGYIFSSSIENEHDRATVRVAKSTPLKKLVMGKIIVSFGANVNYKQYDPIVFSQDSTFKVTITSGTGSTTIYSVKASYSNP